MMTCTSARKLLLEDGLLTARTVDAYLNTSNSMLGGRIPREALVCADSAIRKQAAWVIKRLADAGHKKKEK